MGCGIFGKIRNASPLVVITHEVELVVEDELFRQSIGT
jgi:hypothetical protein